MSRGFTGDGKYLLLGTGAGGPRLWDWRSANEVFRCPPPPGLKAFSATLTPDDRQLIVGYDDGTVIPPELVFDRPGFSIFTRSVYMTA
ncbi:MAG: hypothetical protein JWO38_1619 [Gemmataceae bacterium]|nr:hypothetical protein [Gemmataceae bacterium]